MSIYQLNMNGEDKVQVAIQRYKMFEPAEGYYLAFSGGKDSVVIKALAEMSGVKFDAHYNLTTVDPPELVRFIKDQHPDVEIHRPEKSMWQLIVEKRMPPTRLVRYCCDVLKEGGGDGRFVVTGVRWAESVKRKNNRDMVEFDTYGSQSKEAKQNREKFKLMNDNNEKRMMIENCVIKGKHILNPIVDWTEQEVWEFIKDHNIAYCHLYDEGWKRLGCIGCPMSGKSGMQRDFKRWPKYEAAYKRAFERMIKKRIEDGLENDCWNDANDVMSWWYIEKTSKTKSKENNLLNRSQ